MKQTALITGASGGIGYEFAKIFAEEGYNLVLTARSEEKLQTLKKELEGLHGITAVAIAKDLSAPDAAAELYDDLCGMDMTVDVLVNNAGFADHAGFLDSDWSRQKDMVALNVVALMQMTYLFGDDMRKRGFGRILNVSSVASVSAGPYMSVYYASKAFVLSFSQAVGEELKGTGVTVAALCPGPTTTGFELAAQLKGSRMFTALKPATADRVAKAGYEAAMRGKAVKFHGALTKLMNLGAHLTPRGISRKFAKMINGVPPAEKTDNHKCTDFKP